MNLRRKRQAISNPEEGTGMKAIVSLALAGVAAFAAGNALAQADLRMPLPQPITLKQGMLNVPALSPLWLLPEEAAKYNIRIETVMFQRFADARTALVTGDIHLTAFGPQDISLALGQGAKTLVGVAGVGSGNDCLVGVVGRPERGDEDVGRTLLQHRRPAPLQPGDDARA
jgi:sulfonate transport system substrate-binding protein